MWWLSNNLGKLQPTPQNYLPRRNLSQGILPLLKYAKVRILSVHLVILKLWKLFHVQNAGHSRLFRTLITYTFRLFVVPTPLVHRPFHRFVLFSNALHSHFILYHNGIRSKMHLKRVCTADTKISHYVWNDTSPKRANVELKINFVSYCTVWYHPVLFWSPYLQSMKCFVESVWTHNSGLNIKLLEKAF